MIQAFLTVPIRDWDAFGETTEIFWHVVGKKSKGSANPPTHKRKDQLSLTARRTYKGLNRPELTERTRT